MEVLVQYRLGRRAGIVGIMGSGSFRRSYVRDIALSASALCLAVACSSGDDASPEIASDAGGAAGQSGGKSTGGASGAKATGGSSGAKATGGSSGAKATGGSSGGKAAGGSSGATSAGGASGATSGGGASGKAGIGGSSGAGATGGSSSAGKGGTTSAGGSAGTASGGSSAGGSTGIETPPAPARGAAVPYWEYEAESATTNGVVLPSSRAFGDVASEASGRSAVRLEATGQHVSFTTEHKTSSIVVRYSIPDSPSGGGTTATLGLYVGGVRIQSLTLTSRYSWTYGDADAQNEGSESPSAGTPHHFFDEVHALFPEVPAGTAIALQRDAMDTAQSYIVDLVDFEDVAPPLPQPPGSLSIVDFGATPDDGTDDSAAIQNAIDMASSKGAVVWIPKGTFTLPPKPAQKPGSGWPKIHINGVTIRGAGMWYSTLSGFSAQFSVSGNGNVLSDFAVFGDVTYRDDAQGFHGFDGPWGTGSSLTNVWVEHQTAGLWVGHGGASVPIPAALTDGLKIHGARIRDTYADGVNFADGTRNSIVEQSSFRNTGDDSIASWSNMGAGPPCQSNTFSFDTVQAPWRATCFALYGGKDAKVSSSVCADTSNFPGLYLSTTSAFTPWPFDGITTVEQVTLTRAGGPHYGYDHGALKLYSSASGVHGIHASDLDLEDSTFAGVQIEGAQTVSDVTLSNVTIHGYGTFGIWVTADAKGSASADGVVVTGGTGVGLKNDAGGAFTFQKGAGDSGW